MTRKAKELLERVRAADQLDARALDRMSEELLWKLGRGESALPGIDASPIMPPKLSWAARILAGTTTNFGVGLLLLGVITGASVWGMRVRHAPDSAKSARQATQPNAASTPPSAAFGDQSASTTSSRAAGTVQPGLPPARNGRDLERAAASAQARAEPTTATRGSERRSTHPARRHDRHPDRTGAGASMVSAPLGIAALDSSVSAPAAASASASSQLRATQSLAAAQTTSADRLDVSALTAAPSDPARPLVMQPAAAHTAAPAQPLAPQPTRTSATQPSSADPETHLDAELGLLRRAYTELNAGRPDAAFDVLDEHASRYPHGVLEQAREVARMLALCAMGRQAAAHVRAQNFLAQYPDSTFTSRVRRGCPVAKTKMLAPRD